ncbi:MAG: hypothetical protein A2V46_06530 [Bacteroidetes bacterium RBG_19FT_COMBO_42_7]|nr:MAG: hypothetical protein A2V46_06530 [Bacteroidetes bacterium RBG_19FT_COMBO_42_7]
MISLWSRPEQVDFIHIILVRPLITFRGFAFLRLPDCATVVQTRNETVPNYPIIMNHSKLSFSDIATEMLTTFHSVKD